MSMAGVGHLGLLNKLILTCLAWNGNDFIHLKHALGKLIEVATPDDEYSCMDHSNLDSLEVVRKIGRCLHRH